MFDQQQQWMMERCGKFTASEIHKLMVPGKSKNYFGDAAESYIRNKAAEVLTMEINNGGRLNTYAMEWGNAHEYEAVRRFEEDYKLPVEYFGGANPKFYEYSSFSGGSPDGFAGEDAIIEVKCPFNSSEHLSHLLLNDEIDIKSYCKEYYWQMVFNMICTNTNQAYFISYDPRFADEKLQLKVIDFKIPEYDAALIKERVNEAEKTLSVLINLVRNEI